ncbi:MreB-like protein [bioreactor metagenome]|uniref:MreB-like protein n=1 Tax=bioreactor metagenome TaxID=1076179 RepID=A0A644T5E1_9ZZZZ|nr:rod shape-determining protein [Candidatus Elulimicrobiales bacterium]
MFNKYFSRFSNDIGIDLGTTNTLVSLRGTGIVINEPSVVAINNKTNKIVALGIEAKNMMGRTPEHITIIRPIIDGVISDYEVTEEFLSYLINKANNLNKKFLRPRVVIGIPIGVTDVEIRAVEDAANSAGAREVYILEEAAAAAIGMGLSIETPTGSMVVDIGGGTTDIAITSLSGIVKRKNLKIAGDKMNQDIISYIRNHYKVLIGEKTAEEIKMEIGSALPDNHSMIETSISIKGRDLVSGLPKEINVNESDIREAMAPSLFQIVEAVRETLETAPPEILGDILRDGIILTGGGSLIKNIDKLFEENLKVAAHISVSPLTDVVVGTEIVLSDLARYHELIIKDSKDIIPIE